MSMRRSSILGWVAVLWLAGCAGSGGQLFSVEQGGYPIAWSEAELVKPLAMRTLRRSEEMSVHVVRLAGDESPHVHDHSDLTVTLLRGRVRMNLAGRTFVMEAGDVVEVPRGVEHWAENLFGPRSEAYVLFTPPLREGDHRPTR